MSAENENDSFDSKTSTFMSWLQQRPGINISPKIQIADLRDYGAGRGIVAAAEIEENEELFSIPRADVLTVQDSDLQRAKPEVLESLDTWNSLVLVMIYEDGQGTRSRWWPYLQILPTVFDTLIYWSPSELAELQGSAVLDKIGKDGANAAFIELLLPIVQEHPEIFGRHVQAFSGFNAESTLLELAHRMASLIMAYGFDLEEEPSSSSEEEELEGSSQASYEINKGMVPLADLFNANGDLNNAHLLQQDETMTMVALKKVLPGQEIFNDFGQLPRSDLLRRYGFITDNYKQWDVVEIDIKTIIHVAGEHRRLSDGEREQRIELAATWDILQDGYDLNRPSSGKAFKFDSALTLTIYALLLDPQQFSVVTEEPPAKPPETLRPALGLILRMIITSRQNMYHTSLAADYALLEHSALEKRRKMAVEVRLGEKEILGMAAAHCDQHYLNSQHDANGEHDRNYAKRLKV